MIRERSLDKSILSITRYNVSWTLIDGNPVNQEESHGPWLYMAQYSNNCLLPDDVKTVKKKVCTDEADINHEYRYEECPDDCKKTQRKHSAFLVKENAKEKAVRYHIYLKRREDFCIKLSFKKKAK